VSKSRVNRVSFDIVFGVVEGVLIDVMLEKNLNETKIKEF